MYGLVSICPQIRSWYSDISNSLDPCPITLSPYSFLFRCGSYTLPSFLTYKWKSQRNTGSHSQLFLKVLWSFSPETFYVIRELGNLTRCLDMGLFKSTDPRHCIALPIYRPWTFSSSGQEHFLCYVITTFYICAPFSHFTQLQLFSFHVSEISSPRLHSPIMASIS